MSASDFKIEPVESAPFGQLTYVAWKRGGTEAVVVDPGFDTEAILDVLRRQRLEPAALLVTHGHVDHIAGIAALKEAFPDAPIVIGKGDEPLLTDPDANLSRPFGMPMTSPPADRLVADGDRLELAGFEFLVREIPGHSPGSVVYLCEGSDTPFAFVGDVLFAGSVGRTDLGGDATTLLAGIREKLLTLPDGTLILPGHGSPTTIGTERQSNPYVGESAGLYNPGS